MHIFMQSTRDIPIEFRTPIELNYLLQLTVVPRQRL